MLAAFLETSETLVDLDFEDFATAEVYRDLDLLFCEGGDEANTCIMAAAARASTDEHEEKQADVGVSGSTSCLIDESCFFWRDVFLFFFSGTWEEALSKVSNLSFSCFAAASAL